jgi:hypothetical protein
VNAARALIIGCCALALSLFGGSLQAASVASVQSGSLTVATAGTSTVAIAAVDPARSVLFFSTRHAADAPANAILRGRVASGTTLEFVSAGAGPITVQWYVAQFAYGVSVQRGATTQAATTLNVPISPVTALAQAFVTWSKTPGGGDPAIDADDPVIVDLTAVDNLQIRAAQANPAHVIWWQVVEFTNPADIRVQRGTTAMTGSTTQVSQAITTVAIGSSFVLAGFTTTGSGNDIDTRMITAEFQNASRVRFWREDSGDDVTEIAWQVVELLDGTTVQRGVANLNGTQTLRTSAFAGDVTRAVALASVQAAAGQSLGRTRYDSSATLGMASATLTLSATQLSVERAVGGDHTRVEWFIVEFNQAAQVLGSFDISMASGASTCVPLAVTVRALDTLGNPFTGYTGTAELTVSTGNGNWSIGTGNGTLVPNPDTDDDGAASYTFDATDLGVTVLDLSNAHADDLTITAQDTAAAVTATSGLVSFRDNAFVITNNEFLYPVAGRDHAFDVALWQRDTSLPTPNCQIATAYSGVRNLDGWYDPGAAHPAGANAPAIEQGGVPFALGQGVGAATPVNLNFNNGVANFNLRSTDVGQYVLNLRDDTAGFATVTISGASSQLTVRPFGFAITGIIAAGANPGGTAPGDPLFNAAGDPFRAQFEAVLYGAGDPLDANGNPTSWIALENNANAPSFAWDTQLGAVLNTPPAGVGGVAGVLDRPGGTQIDAADFALGAALPIDLRYSEVGSMFVGASANNYLGAAGLSVQGQSQAVGRFSPSAFTVIGNVPTYAAACTAFTYLGQPFDYSPGARPQATITAVNALGATTLNYFDFGAPDDWWLLGDIAELYADPGGNLIYSGVGASHNSSAIPTANGQVVVTFLGTLTYTRTLPYADGLGVDPFVAAPTLSFTVTDPDGVTFNGGAAFTFAIPEAVGQNGVRHGRLRLQSAHGSEVLDLPAPLTLQTFDGTNFTTTTDDNCTAVAVADFTYVGVPIASAVTPFAVGDGSLDWLCSVASPCASGFVDVSGALAAAGLGWLRYDWNGDNVEEEPTGRVTFGIHAGANRNIHIREVF